MTHVVANEPLLVTKPTRVGHRAAELTYFNFKMQGDLSHKELGREGELLALDYLKKEGFRLLEKNYRSRQGEIDLVVEKGEDIYFVEVKTRRSFDTVSPYEMISSEKERHLSRVALHYFAKKRVKDRAGIFALLVVDLSKNRPEFEWIPDIFELRGGF
jgi:putative endonuclease